MTSATSLRRRDVRLVVGILAGFAVVAVLVSTTKGAGMSPDSSVYVAAARHVAHGQGLVGYDGSVLTQFPPGFSLILASGRILGVDAESVSRIVNALAFGALVVLGFLLLRRHVASRGVVAAATVAIALSPVLLRVSGMAWSDPLFAVVTIAFVLDLEDYVKTSARRFLIGAVALVWVGFLLRYAGVSLLLAGALVIVCASQTERFAAFRRAVAFTAAALTLPAAWAIRNLAEGSDILGDRSASERGVATNTLDTLKALSEWALPQKVPTVARLVVLGGILVGALLVIAMVTRHREVPTASWFPLLVVAGIYTAYLIASASVTQINVINERLLLPLFVPFVVLIAIAVDLLPAGLARRLVMAAFLLWLAWSTVAFFKAVRDRANDGIGFASTTWKNSPLLHSVKALPASASLYSNSPDAIYAVVRKDASFVPTPTSTAQVGCGSYVAWFTNSGHQPFIGTPAQLRRTVSLATVKRTDDGTLYRVVNCD